MFGKGGSVVITTERKKHVLTDALFSFSYLLLNSPLCPDVVTRGGHTAESAGKF